MTHTRPSNRIEAPGKPGAELIAELEQLRDSNRLGIHIWEFSDMLQPPEYSQNLLAVAAAEIAERMQGRTEMSCRPSPRDPNDIPATSLSMIPSIRSGLSMIPYEGVDFRSAGFLVDLRQDQPHPTRILRTSPDNLNSNEEYLKNILTDLQYEHLRFRRFTRDMDTPGLIARACGPEGPRWGAEQLDALGEHYLEMENDPEGLTEEFMVMHNEVIACASHEHVKAIVRPYYYDNYAPYLEPVSRLLTALDALQMHENGTDLPAVRYYVNGPEANCFEYLGGTQKELEATAMKALRDMASQPDLMRPFYEKPHYADDRATIDSMVKAFLDVPAELRQAALNGSQGHAR